MRRAIVKAAEAYVGLPYRNGAGMGPTELDCSGLVERAVMDAFPDSPIGLLCPFTTFTTARGMWELLEATTGPDTADIAVYVSPDDDYHVMLVDDGVLGACPDLGCVGRHEMHDYAPDRWRLKGFRRLPVGKLRARAS